MQYLVLWRVERWVIWLVECIVCGGLTEAEVMWLSVDGIVLIGFIRIGKINGARKSDLRCCLIGDHTLLCKILIGRRRLKHANVAGSVELDCFG